MISGHARPAAGSQRSAIIYRRVRRHREGISPVASALIVVIALSILVAGPVESQRNKPPDLIPSMTRALAITTIPLDGSPFGVAFNPENDYLYVNTPNISSTNVTVINTTTNDVVTSVPLPTFSAGPIAVDASSGEVYVGDYASTVYAIQASTNQIEGTVPLLVGCPNGCAPDVQVYNPANGDVYITSVITNNVSVIHGTSFVTSIPAGAGPNGAAYDSTNGDVYVSNEGSCLLCANLTVINGTTNRVVGQVPGSGGGPGVTFDSSNGDLYVCQNAAQAGQANFVTVVNGSTNSVVASIPISSVCGRDAYDPANNYVYVTNRLLPGGQYLSNVTLIDPNTNEIVLTQRVGLGPIPIAYDPANQNVYVGNAVSDSITVLPQIYRLTVHETGLRTGTNWSATVGGTTFSSTASTITFPESNGTFGFSVANSKNSSACPPSGNVTVAGGPREVNLTFSTSACGGSPSGFLGLSGATGYYLLGGSVAVLVAATAVVIALTRRKRRALPPVTVAPAQDR